MSDVERICEMNHQRVRWAEEVENGLPRRQGRLAMTDGEQQPLRHAARDTFPCTGEAGGRPMAAPTGCRGVTALPSEKMQKKRRALRTASLFCAMMCGVSAACIVRGAVMTDMQTLVPGVIGAVVFLTSGWLMDEKVEELSV